MDRSSQEYYGCSCQAESGLYAADVGEHGQVKETARISIHSNEPTRSDFNVDVL